MSKMLDTSRKTKNGIGNRKYLRILFTEDLYLKSRKKNVTKDVKNLYIAQNHYYLKVELRLWKATKNYSLTDFALRLDNY